MLEKGIVYAYNKNALGLQKMEYKKTEKGIKHMYSKMLWGQKRLQYETQTGAMAVITVHYSILCVPPRSDTDMAYYGIAVEQNCEGKPESCMIAPFTNDVQAVRRLLTLLQKNEVLPVHVPEIWQDLYGQVPVLLAE